MQGCIFTAFSDMIIEKMGMQEWNDLISATVPSSQGAYTSGEQYDDKEIFNMVVHLSNKTGISPEVLVQAFGKYLFVKLYNNSPADISKITKLRDFLLAIDQVIHVEVKRLHPEAYLPQFDYENGREGELIMYYHSKRKLCHCSIGLIEGAAEKFNETISIDHAECMHKGAERCKFIIQFKE